MTHRSPRLTSGAFILFGLFLPLRSAVVVEKPIIIVNSGGGAWTLEPARFPADPKRPNCTLSVAKVGSSIYTTFDSGTSKFVLAKNQTYTLRFTSDSKPAQSTNCLIFKIYDGNGCGRQFVIWMNGGDVYLKAQANQYLNIEASDVSKFPVDAAHPDNDSYIDPDLANFRIYIDKDAYPGPVTRTRSGAVSN